MKKVKLNIKLIQELRYSRNYFNYQYRNIGFLLEILTTFLLCKELHSHDINIFSSCGCLVIVDKNKQYVRGTAQ